MCFIDKTAIKKNHKIEISVADFEELVSAYTRSQEIKDSFKKMHFLSGISCEDLSQINWVSFEYLPGSALEEEPSKVNVFKVKFEGELVKRG